MKNGVLSIVLFIVSFVVVYLIMCYLPSMRIKLAAEPMEYFVESIKHNMSFKLLISSAIGVFVIGLSFIFRKYLK